MTDVSGPLKNVSSQVRDVSSQVRDVSSRVRGVYLFLERDFKTILEGLAANEAALKRLEEAVTSPLKTGAADRVRAGLYALARGFYKEAVEEFTKALELWRYDCSTWVCLGLAYISDSNAEEPRKNYEQASTAFRNGVRFGDPDNVELRAGCALLGAACYIEMGSRADASDILRQSFVTDPRCPEVSLALWQLTGDPEALRQLLLAAPEYIAQIQLDTREESAAVEAVVADADGPVARAQRVANALGKLATDPREDLRLAAAGAGDQWVTLLDSGSALERLCAAAAARALLDGWSSSTPESRELYNQIGKAEREASDAHRSNALANYDYRRHKAEVDQRRLTIAALQQEKGETRRPVLLAFALTVAALLVTLIAMWVFGGSAWLALICVPPMLFVGRSVPRWRWARQRCTAFQAKIPEKGLLDPKPPDLLTECAPDELETRREAIQGLESERKPIVRVTPWPANRGSTLRWAPLTDSAERVIAKARFG